MDWITGRLSAIPEQMFMIKVPQFVGENVYVNHIRPFIILNML
jgi:hypothetical protein